MSDSEDGCIFWNFFIYCLKDSDRKNSAGVISKFRVAQGELKD